MKAHFINEVLTERDSPLPLTIDGTVVIAHQREGMESAVLALMSWKPELVEEADEN